jgi:predicted transcriptional regulator
MIAERKNTRGRVEIIASILFHCREGIKKTHIMSKANVGYEQLCYYLPNLIDSKLVKQDIEDGSVIYRTTDTGREFLKSYYNITNLLNYASKDYKDLNQYTLNKQGPTLNRQSITLENRQLIFILKESEG